MRQTLIAGVLAFAAGFGTVVAAIWAIWVTRSLERDRIASESDALRASLAVEIRQYIDMLLTTREIPAS